MKFDSAQYLAWQEKSKSNKFFRFATELAGVYSAFLFFGFGVYLFIYHLQTGLIILTAFIFARILVVGVIDYFYKKSRPYEHFNFKPNSANLFSALGQHQDSFPSQHVISMAAISVALWNFSPIIAIVGLIISALVGAARVMLGRHYPIDILGGLVLGAASGWLVLIFTK